MNFLKFSKLFRNSHLDLQHLELDKVLVNNLFHSIEDMHFLKVGSCLLFICSKRLFFPLITFLAPFNTELAENTRLAVTCIYNPTS